MNQNLTEVICVIDKSGSMSCIRDDAIGAFNTFLEDQQALPGEARLTLTLFDDEYKIVHDGVPIKDVPKLTNKTYAPDGCTALYDAAGRTIDKVGGRLAQTPEDERPAKVIMVILTDGQENSSKEYTRQMLFDKINHQRDTYKWEFVFLAANQDAMTAGQSIGVQNNVNYVASGSGTRGVVQCMSSAVSSYRSCGSVGTLPDQA